MTTRLQHPSARTPTCDAEAWRALGRAHPARYPQMEVQDLYKLDAFVATVNRPRGDVATFRCVAEAVGTLA